MTRGEQDNISSSFLVRGSGGGHSRRASDRSPVMVLPSASAPGRATLRWVLRGGPGAPAGIGRFSPAGFGDDAVEDPVDELRCGADEAAERSGLEVRDDGGAPGFGAAHDGR